VKSAKLIKQLLSESYEVQNELVDLIEECFKDIFGSNSTYLFSEFEADIASGRDYNGCLQGLAYYKSKDIEHQKHRALWIQKEKEKEDGMV